MLRPSTILKLLPQIIMGHLGYAKIPLDIVQRSMEQEARIAFCMDCETDEIIKRRLKVMLEQQNELTHFLRRSRAIAPKERK